ncbi:MAG: bifunctional pyr operon transcriptional regulator/uracil phosphoribosyltransferase PyrR [Acholeplasmatales bacterium]|nr:bifunctional pyr operon transcriptional regulator/uracil phosphoribosyltransferase PyrR [Acholeplasmatales bacterium]
MKVIMESEQIGRTIRRMSHEIIEKNIDLTEVILIGIKSKGTPIAKLLSDNIYHFENVRIPVEELDISKYRDDEKKTDTAILNISQTLHDKVVVLVDDVLFTGRSARAAMDAVMDLGRAKRIQLAVLVDRGHRELPIRPDYVGKNIPTSRDENVVVNLDENIIYIK